MPLFRRSIALALALVLLSPSLECSRAFAAVLARPSAPSSVQPISLPSYSARSLPGMAPAMAAPAAGALVLPAAAAAPQAESAAPAAAAAGQSLGTGAAEALRAGVASIESARENGGEKGALDSLFAEKTAAASADAVAAQPGSGPAPLSPAPAPDLSALKSEARDAKKTPDQRLSAVKAIANLSTDFARLALEEIGAERGGTAADYEIKRAALRALAEQGVLRSLPPVSAEHAKELLQKASPLLVQLDLDGVVKGKGRPIAPEMGAALEALSKAGAHPMIVTDRSAVGRGRAGDVGVLDALREGLTPSQRHRVSVAPYRGAEIWHHDAEGEGWIAEKAESWSPDQRAALERASSRVFAAHGRASEKPVTTPYDSALFLPKTLSEAELAAAAELLRAELKAANVEADVIAWRPAGEQFTLLTASKHDKSRGAAAGLRLRDRLERSRLVAGRPSQLRALVRAIVDRLPARPIDGKSVVIVGDRFMGEQAIDAPMMKGAPGALGISVGGTADPRLDNVFVWPTDHADGALEVVKGLAAKKEKNPNRWALGAYFTQRTISFLVYIPTVVAFPFLAIPAVGLAQFLALMALGGLASVVLAPLTSIFAKKLSSRSAVIANTALRTALQVFVVLATLDFGSLLLAAIANGWLLASIVATDGILLNRMSKNFPRDNRLAWMNYLVAQVGMGMLGFAAFQSGAQWVIGALGLAAFMPANALLLPFLVAAVVNVAVIIPISLLLPGNDATPAPAEPKKPLLERAKALAKDAGAFFGKYVEHIALVGGAVAAFFVNPALTVIPAAVGMLLWLRRTPNYGDFKAAKLLKPVLLAAIGAAIFITLQGAILPWAAGVVAGAAGKAQLFSQLLGAMFMGQLISNAAAGGLPRLRVGSWVDVDSGLLLKAAVIALSGVWSAVMLFPGSWGLAAAISAGALALTWLSGKLKGDQWVRALVVGMGAMALLPLLIPGPAGLLLGALTFGLFYGPASVALGNAFFGGIPNGRREDMVGVQSAIINAAISIGFGAFDLLTKTSPSFAGVFTALSAVYLAVGALFFAAWGGLPLLKQLWRKIRK